MKIWITLLSVVVVLNGMQQNLVTAADATQPNVILILADDMAVGDLSCLNGGQSRTPNLDRLKEQSVWFDQAYSASPVCAPARAALLTGRYPHRTGVVSLNMEKYPSLTRLSLREKTMADIFREQGYVTGLIGKWHLGIGEDYHPLSRGFDEFQGFIGYKYVPNYFRFKLDIQRETIPQPDKYLTTDLSKRAIDFVRRQRDKPFFLHLAHYAPHRPLNAPEDRVQPYQDAGLEEDTATIYAMIEIMDEGIGQLMKELDKLEMSEKTIVLFASDNGPDMLVEKRFNVGLRGTKYMVNEGGIRVPFMVRWQGKILPATNHYPIHFTDVLPTLADLCGLQLPEGRPLDGHSFGPVLHGEAIKPRQHRMWQWNRLEPRYSHNAAIREGDWKLVRPFVTKNVPNGDSDLPRELYDLSEDPDESHNLAEAHPDRVRSMNASLEAWTKQVEEDRLRAVRTNQ